MSRLRKVFPYFAGAFAMFFVVGFLRTCTPTAREKLALHEITSNTVIQRREQNYTLYYLCKGQTLYSYDLTNRRVFRSIGAIETGLRAELQQDHPFDAQVAATFMGGGAGVYTIKDLSQALASAKSSDRIVAFVLGAVSGYVLGFETGKALGSSCDMPEVHAKLQTPAEWQQIANARYAIEVVRKLDRGEFSFLYMDIGSPYRRHIEAILYRLQTNFNQFNVASSDFWALDVAVRRMQLARLLAEAMGSGPLVGRNLPIEPQPAAVAFYRAELAKSDTELMSRPTGKPPPEEAPTALQLNPLMDTPNR